MTYVSQIIVLNTLNVYRVVGQLYLNKTIREKRRMKKKWSSLGAVPATCSQFNIFGEWNYCVWRG